MALNYQFNVISLGVLADIDTDLAGVNNFVSENAAALVGSSFGTVATPLYNNFTTFIYSGALAQTAGGAFYYDNSNAINTRFSIAGGPAHLLDGVAEYNATITYMNGTTTTVTAVMFQDKLGNAYIAPELSVNADQLAYETAGIQSISLDSVSSNASIGFAALREAWAYVICFATGTEIATPNGPVAVENLCVGDLVNTRDNGAQTLRWHGSTKVAATGDLAPIVISKGALGNSRDLVVSPQHRILLKGWRAELMFGEPEILCATVHLVNGDTIYRREGGEVEYHHILFDRHEIVSSEGIPTESFHPGQQGMGALSEDARQEIYTLFPELHPESGQMRKMSRPSLKSFEARALMSGA